MRRLKAAAFPLALVGALAATIGIVVGESAAELEAQVFTSRADRIRLVVPRGWRATDQPSYPGLLLWMMRSQPPGEIVLAGEAFTRELYCSWPIACRTSHESPAAKYACALRNKLESQKLRVGPPQQGPKDNEVAGLPSMWFEYDDGKRFVRQAVALGASNRAISLVLSAPTNEARAAHVRAFEQALRTLRALTEQESAASATTDAGAGTSDGLVGDAAALPSDGGADAGAMFESAPAPRIDPIGPCL